MRLAKDKKSYDYLGCHTDNITIVAKDPQSILTELLGHYTITKPGAPKYHLGCDYSLKPSGGEMRWHIGSMTHVSQAIEKAEDALGKFFGKKDYAIPKCTTNESKVPMAHGKHPEEDDSGLLNEEGHRCYQQFIGSAQWIVSIGRADIQYAVTSPRHQVYLGVRPLKSIVRLHDRRL